MNEVDGTRRTIAHASARGASHIRRDKPNQDDVGGFVERSWALIVCSDGHGAETCFRSDRGSRFVVDAVKRICSRLVADRSASSISVAEFHGLPRQIVAEWRSLVLRDAEGDADPRFSPGDPFEAYGATCVAALMGVGASFFMQVGDGDLVASATEGQLARPLPDDDGLVGEQTYSICLPDAVALFRTLLFQSPHPLAKPDFVAVSSDGLSKSFPDVGGFLEVMQQWRSLARGQGLAAIEPKLEDWLSNCSSSGSGDDVSLAMCVEGLDELTF
jgi:hypothetical protein